MPQTTVALLAEGVGRNTHFRTELINGPVSPSSRRAWVEIDSARRHFCAAQKSPSSRRAWVEIKVPVASLISVQSPSSRRAWVEISVWLGSSPKGTTSPSSRRAWVEILLGLILPDSHLESPSSRRAWVEIGCAGRRLPAHAVALLAEGVGRNKTRYKETLEELKEVALLAEGVGRNPYCHRENHQHGKVALLAEGVGRNNNLAAQLSSCCWSPSSRRAWVEICSYRAALWPAYCRPPRGGRG